MATHHLWGKFKSQKKLNNFWQWFSVLFPKPIKNWGVPKMIHCKFLHMQFWFRRKNLQWITLWTPQFLIGLVITLKITVKSYSIIFWLLNFLQRRCVQCGRRRLLITLLWSLGSGYHRHYHHHLATAAHSGSQEPAWRSKLPIKSGSRVLTFSRTLYCEAQGKGRAKGRPRKVTKRSFIDMDGGWWLSFPWCFTLNLVATTTHPPSTHTSLNIHD